MSGLPPGMYVHPHMCSVPAEVRNIIRFPGTRVIAS